MSNYVQSTNFATKDNLSSGDPLKIVKGTEINTEFANIAIAVATKADLASPTFTGTPAAPTASAGTNTTQIATTAFVTSIANSLGTMSTQNANNVAITGGSIAGITDLAIADGGTGASTAATARTNLGTNDATNLTTGTVATARLGTGTANSTTYLRGDGVWSSLAAPTGVDAIGTVMFVAANTTSFLLPGSTISGSNLYYMSTVSYYTSGTASALSEGASPSAVPRTTWSYYSISFAFSYVERLNTGNTGFVAPQGSTALSGTWRILTPTPERIVGYDACANRTESRLFNALAVRIA